MTKNRYEFTGATRDCFGRTLQEIRATINLTEFGVAAGESGGWIESAACFPQSSKGWIYPPAIVLEGGDIRGGDMITIQPLNLGGLRWPITITDSHMAIGCQHHALEKWWKFSDALITKMDSNALDFWQANKAMLQALCQSSGRESGL